MKTIILPGYSPHNNAWAYEVKKYLGNDSFVYEWKHWSFEKSMSVKREVEEIVGIIGKETVNIIAKSVGTRVAMLLLLKIPEKINKIILCGIPTKGDREKLKVNNKVVDRNENIYFQGLSKIDSKNVIIFQNTSDPLAKYQDIRNFIGSMFPDIKIVEKPRNDHHYPYYEDFSGFL